MFIIHLALGGCLKAPPVNYGVTADTGGHIAYVLEAAQTQARLDAVTHVSIVTRLFRDDRFDQAHAQPIERIEEKLSIERVATANTRYLGKEALGEDLTAFTNAFCSYIDRLSSVPDVIHAHFADAAAVAIEAKRRFGIPFVYTPHALGIDKRKSGLECADMEHRIRAERNAIAQADAVIVSTKDEAERQIAAYSVATEGRIHCLSPGVPHRDVPPSGHALNTRFMQWFDHPERPVILAIARAVRKKNLIALMTAYANDAELRNCANLVILAGQHDHACGEEREVLQHLQAMAKNKDLQGRCALPARHDPGDVAALYARAAKGGVFVNPALHEPFGLTIIEAAAAGVPVVATRNGGPAEILARLGHGILVNPKDSASIAAACKSIIHDADLHSKYARSARNRVAHYSWQSYARDSLEIYRAATRPALLACDIDNTLTGCRESALAFTSWAGSRAIPFVVATGRSFRKARRVLAEWRLPEPDAYIVDVGTRMMLRNDAGEWMACPRYAAHLSEEWNREAVMLTLAGLDLTHQPRNVQTEFKASFFGGDTDAQAIRQALDNAGVQAKVVFSHGRLIDVLPIRGGKAAAVAAYAAGHGLPISACIAAGDSGNDEDLLTRCGQSIVVANADDDLAGLGPRQGLYRARRPHAAGVLEGLARLGMMESTLEAVA